MTKDEVIAQSIMFFLAGYDTTATSIAFLTYNLALNPEIQEELYEEIVNFAADKVLCHHIIHATKVFNLFVKVIVK